MDTLRNPPKGLKIPDDLRQWGERHKRFRKLCVEVFLLRDVDKRYRDFMRSRSSSCAGEYLLAIKQISFVIIPVQGPPAGLTHSQAMQKECSHRHSPFGRGCGRNS